MSRYSPLSWYRNSKGMRSSQRVVRRERTGSSRTTTAVDDWRLTVASTVVLATGGLVKPLLTLIPCKAPEVLTTPLTADIHDQFPPGSQ